MLTPSRLFETHIVIPLISIFLPLIVGCRRFHGDAHTVRESIRLIGRSRRHRAVRTPSESSIVSPNSPVPKRHLSKLHLIPAVHHTHLWTSLEQDWLAGAPALQHSMELKVARSRNSPPQGAVRAGLIGTSSSTFMSGSWRLLRRWFA